MRALRSAAVLLVALVASPAGAQTGSTSTTLAPLPPTEFQTVVKGTVPDLTGRWIAVAWLEVPGGGTRTATFILEVESAAGKPRVTMPFAHLPAEQEGAMQRASEASERWEPSPADIAAISNGWSRLPPMERHTAKLDSYLTGRDAFDDTFTADPRTRDAQWVLQQTETFDASAAPAVRQVHVFSVLEARDGGYRGNYTTTLLAAAPFPIPITLQGTFQLIKLAPEHRGVLTRLGDLFSGCRR